MSNPLLYEINTRCWLHDLSQEHGAAITLANIPATEFARWQILGFTHIWLMGVWRTGPRGREFSRRLPDLRETCAKLLPDFTEKDIVGSPYAIAGYEVSEDFGGESALREFRNGLNAAGLKLILDFIPNHTGLDHPWLEKAPERFIQSPEKKPGTFRQDTDFGPRWIAQGKDPYFAPWTDTAQLDYTNPATRAAVIGELKSVARRCDGVRCDMAMLVLDDIFAQNWSKFRTATGKELTDSIEPAARKSESHDPWIAPEKQFWAEAISTIKATQPEFLFLAEAYWNLEKRLLELGFDFAYDKQLTDHLLARRFAAAHRHLLAMAQDPIVAVASRGSQQDTSGPTQSKRTILGATTHFLENHDESRIASLLAHEEHRAAALLILTLPGMRLLHEGQLTGATVRTPVHLRRRPPAIPQAEVAAFYEKFLTTLKTTAVGRGTAELLELAPAWNGNPTAENFVVVQWRAVPMQFDLVVINLAPYRSQCSVKLTVEELAGRNWAMSNLLGSERYEREGTKLRKDGLFLDLPAHGAQLFHFQVA